MTKLSYVNQLAFQLDAVGIPYHREFKFHPRRKWKADFYIEPHILVEVEGLVYHPRDDNDMSRHTSITGYTHDCEKYNAANLLGYSLLRFTQQHIRSGYALDTIEKMIEVNREKR